MNRTTFVFAGTPKVPVGGFKVAFLHAEALAARGWQVRLELPMRARRPEGAAERLLARSLALVKTPSSAIPWFQFRSAKPLFVPWVRGRTDSKASQGIRVAVGHEASRLLPHWTESDPWIQFVQGFEDWVAPEDEIYQVWRRSKKLITISRWLQDLATSRGVEAVVAPNGIELDHFHQGSRPLRRPVETVGILVHPQPLKDARTSISICSALRDVHPQLRFRAFGPHAPESPLPEWLEFTLSPTGDTLGNWYRGCDLFLASSRKEGWGLIPSEAMACGCVVVATDVPGHLEFCVDGVNSLLFPPGDVARATAQATRAISDPELAALLRQAGSDRTRSMDWEKSHLAFERALL